MPAGYTLRDRSEGACQNGMPAGYTLRDCSKGAQAMQEFGINGKNMGKIFCIMGKSSSGKDTLYKQILKTKDLPLSQIILYTTRPIRFGETNGVEYFFVDEQRLKELEAEGKVIEVRAYHTVCGVWKYFTVNDGQIDLAEQNYLMITTLEAYTRFRDYFGASSVESVYVEVEDGLRLKRALEREMLQKEPKYAELCRRFLADTEDFSEEKLKAAGIKNRFLNEDLENTRKEITSYIRSVLRNCDMAGYDIEKGV